MGQGSLTPQLSLPVCISCILVWDCPFHGPLLQLPDRHQRLAVPHCLLSAPPTCVDDCFFKSLVVRLPYSLIFWQFWLFFVFRLFVILRMVVRGDKVTILGESQQDSLSLTFGILIMMRLGMGLFASILFGTLCFLVLHICFLHQIREIFFHHFFK